MVGKKGFLRIIEAMIAVLIVLGALLIISPDREGQKNEDLTDALRSFLDEIAKDQALRNRIVTYNFSKNYDEDENKLILEDIGEFFEENIKNPSFNYSISICKINSTCALRNYPSFDTDIYSAERLITTTLSEGEPTNIRKIKVFLWRRL